MWGTWWVVREQLNRKPSDIYEAPTSHSEPLSTGNEKKERLQVQQTNAQQMFQTIPVAPGKAVKER